MKDQKNIYQIIKHKKLRRIIYCFFLLGFFKHLLGYFLYMHTLYCNYGNACKKVGNNVSHENKYAIFSNILIIESLLEGFLYLFFGIILNKFIKIK